MVPDLGSAWYMEPQGLFGSHFFYVLSSKRCFKSPFDRVHRRPVVGVVASPLKLPGANSFEGLSWIWSTYVESLHDAGADVVPLLPQALWASSGL